VSFWVDASIMAWEKGLVKCHMSVSVRGGGGAGAGRPRQRL